MAGKEKVVENGNSNNVSMRAHIHFHNYRTKWNPFYLSEKEEKKKVSLFRS